MPKIIIEPPHLGAEDPYTGEPYQVGREYEVSFGEKTRLDDWARLGPAAGPNYRMPENAPPPITEETS